MMKGRSLRFRMMVLFCTVVGVFLAASYLAFWGLLAHEVSAQLNRQLQETARPILADLAAEPNSQDINRMDIAGQFFELLDPSGHVLQRSRNLEAPIDLKGISTSALAANIRFCDAWYRRARAHRADTVSARNRSHSSWRSPFPRLAPIACSTASARLLCSFSQ